MKIKHFWNRFLSEYSYNHGLTKVLNEPEVFNIEVTNYCNLDCLMCPRREMTRKLQHMDFDLFKKIVDEGKSVTRSVQLYNFGEPFLCPEIFKMIDYASDAGITTVVSTNALPLNNKMSEKILNSKLDVIIFSFDGAKKETYEMYRRGGNFENVKKNILEFIETKKERGLKKPCTVMQIVNMKETEKEVEEFRKFWEPLCDEVDLRPFNTYADQVEGIKESSDSRFNLGKKRQPCILLWRNFIILANGDVVPCCIDFDGKVVFGNVREQSLKEIWNSEKIQKLREMHVEGSYDFSICKNCLEWYGFEQNRFFPLDTKIAKRFFKYVSKKHV